MVPIFKSFHLKNSVKTLIELYCIWSKSSNVRGTSEGSPVVEDEHENNTILSIGTFKSCEVRPSDFLYMSVGVYGIVSKLSIVKFSGIVKSNFLQKFSL